MIFKKIKSLFQKIIYYFNFTNINKLIFVIRTKKIYKRDRYYLKDFDGQIAHDYIYESLKDSYENKKGFCISRIGHVEMSTIFNSVDSKFRPFKWYNFNRNIDYMKNNAGFFSANIKELKKFVEESINIMKNIDILGSFNLYEKYFDSLFKNTKFIPLRELEPFYVDEPWTRYLEGKKVLVVHPFKDSITYQLSRKDLWLRNKKWLPDCDIKIIRAIQSIAGNKPDEFDSWFDALDYMKSQIKEIDFDIAIIGCGAYGPFLADFVKNMGKQAVVMGGPTQLLFGIKGSRWEINSEYIKNNVFNEYWIRPLDSDKPKNFNNVENGCYW